MEIYKKNDIELFYPNLTVNEIDYLYLNINNYYNENQINKSLFVQTIAFLFKQKKIEIINLKDRTVFESGTFAKIYKINNFAIKKIVNIYHNLTLIESIISNIINHNNIYKWDGFILDKYGQICFFGKLADCELFSIINKICRLNIKQILRIFKFIVCGLFELHNNGIIHRDMKCSNILIFNSDLKKLKITDIKICDFGSCCFRNNEHHIFLKLTTEQYRSPNTDSLCKNIDQYEKIDVWALGCILGELYTGKLLFEKYTDISEYINDPFDYFYKKKIKNDDIINLMLCMINPDIDKRFSCKEILAYLEIMNT